MSGAWGEGHGGGQGRGREPHSRTIVEGVREGVEVGVTNPFPGPSGKGSKGSTSWG